MFPEMARRRRLAHAAFAAIWFVVVGMTYSDEIEPPAVEWERRFGDPASRESEHWVEQTADGNYVVCGGGEGHIVALLIGPDGERIWDRTYGVNTYLESVGRPLCQTSDGGFAIAGNGTEECCLHLFKLDGRGDVVWRQVYRDPPERRAYSIQETCDGGLIVCGHWAVRGIGAVLLLKTDSNGEVVWERTYGQELPHQEDGVRAVGVSVRQTSDDGFIVAGFHRPPRVTTSPYLLKTDAGGALEWSRDFVNEFEELTKAYWVEQTEDGAYTVPLGRPREARRRLRGSAPRRALGKRGIDAPRRERRAQTTSRPEPPFENLDKPQRRQTIAR